MRSRSWWRAFFKAVMAYCRILLRGIWSPPPGDYAGFFATRTVKSARIEDAKAAGLSALAHEWAETPFFEHGGAGLSQTVIDAWRVGWLRAWRSANGGHCFFSGDAESDAAGVEAKAAGARPRPEERRGGEEGGRQV